MQILEIVDAAIAVIDVSVILSGLAKLPKLDFLN